MDDEQQLNEKAAKALARLERAGVDTMQPDAPLRTPGLALAINSSGQFYRPLKEVREDYHRKGWPLGLTELPFCLQNLKAKLLFVLGLSVPVGYAMSIYRTIVPGQNLKKITMRQLAVNSLLALGGMGLMATLETVFFDEACDIDSVFYMEGDRRQVARQVRERYGEG